MESLADVLAAIEAIPEQVCAPPQPRFLHDLCARTPGDGEVVEIGTMSGKSTIALAFAQKTRSGRPIHTIDIVEHPDLAANLNRTGVADWVVRHVARSSTVVKSWTAPIELLWIDADHTYRGLLTDLRRWTPHVVPGGIVAIHDYPGFEHTDQKALAVRRFLLSRPDRWRVISDRDAGSIFAVERQLEAKPPPTLHRAMAWLKWKAHSGRFLVSEMFDLRRS
ncbi:MAG: class I SAM-dependent methyltransferase [Bacteroidota bacterium]